jgi:uncharacterized protein (TIGR03382 family)
MIRGLAVSALLLLQAAPPQGPTVYWKLDEASGAVADDAWGTNNGAHAGGMPSLDRPTLAFQNDQSRAYDGVDDGTSLAQTGLATGNTRHTLAMWIKVNALPANRAWIALLGNPGTGSHHWLINSAGVTQFGVWGGAGQLAPVLAADGLWRHLAAAFDGTTLRVYVNGVAVAANGVAATFNLAGVPLTVAQVQNNENAFNGIIDDVRLYARDLSAAEVQYLAAGNGPPAAPQQLQAVPGILSINLDWQAVAGAASYTLRRTTTLNDPNPPVIASGITGLTYSDPGLDPNTRYYYVVTAVHSVGDESPFSNVADAVPLPIPPRLNDHEEGLLGESCSCGSSIGSASPWALAGLILLGARSRRRRGSRPA